MDGPALPARPCRTVLPGRLGQRRLLEAWDAAAGHFRSVLAEHRAAPQEVPGSALGPDQHVAIEPGHGFVLPLEMFSDTAFIPFGDVGEV